LVWEVTGGKEVSRILDNLQSTGDDKFKLVAQELLQPNNKRGLQLFKYLTIMIIQFIYILVLSFFLFVSLDFKVRNPFANLKTRQIFHFEFNLADVPICT
jgi:hypothetical protein